MEKRQRLNRLILFGGIYFVEGAVLIYFSAFSVLYLRTFDLSFSRIGVIGGISLIPFVLKIFIGLLSDKVNLAGWGYRKPYILIGLVLQALAIFFIQFVSPVSQFPLFLVLMLLTALGMSTYDTCSDGLSIDTTPPEDRGLVQGIMVGGRALSSIIFAAVFGLLSARGNWSMVFTLIAVLALVVLFIALPVKEGKRHIAEGVYQKDAFKAFKDWGFILFLVLGILYPLALYSANSMIGPFLNEVLGVSLDSVGVYLSVFGIGAVLGAVVGGPLMKRIGRRNSILAALLLTTIVTAALALVPSAGLAWVVVFVFGVAFGYYETVYMAMGMDFSDPRIAAFMFSIIMAVGNIGIGLGQPLAGVLVDGMGFKAMFLILAVVHVLSLPLVFGIFKVRKEGIPQ